MFQTLRIELTNAERPKVPYGTDDPSQVIVRAAFEKNFREGPELGAAFALSVAGETVVDLWAGHADLARTRPWQQDTIVAVSSCSKTFRRSRTRSSAT